ncbi:MAG: ExbD/TolR family protein [Myxococcota bacterium]|nr:biopolymer transporter ExbD [Myxococcota bacterium]
MSTENDPASLSNAGGPGMVAGHVRSQDELYSEMRAREKKKAKRMRRKTAHDHPVDVSINSLLDILSVILVFLMKSYSASSVNIKPSKELQIPFTKSITAPAEATAVTVTLKHILVDDVPIMDLEEGGKVRPQDLAEEQMMLQPLYNKLLDEVEKRKKIMQRNTSVEAKIDMTLIADRFVPFDLLTRVMYTAGQAEFSKFDFIAIKLEGG